MDFCAPAAGIDAYLPAATFAPALQGHAPFAAALAALRHHLAQVLFAAQDEVELETAFDDLLDDSEFTARVSELMRAVSVSMVQESVAVLRDDVSPALLKMFSHSRQLMDLARECWALSRAMTAVYFELMAKAAAGSAAPHDTPPARTSEALAAPVPIFLKRLLLHSRKAEAASLALQAAPEHAEDWLTTTLLRTWHTSMQSYLQTLGGLGHPLPDQARALVPVGRPVDVHADYRAAAIREVRNEERLAEARKQGATCYPPMPDEPNREDEDLDD